jgi:hypothetical protein
MSALRRLVAILAIVFAMSLTAGVASATPAPVPTVSTSIVTAANSADCWKGVLVKWAWDHSYVEYHESWGWRSLRQNTTEAQWQKSENGSEWQICNDRVQKRLDPH